MRECDWLLTPILDFCPLKWNRIVSAPSRFGPGSFRPGSFRPLVVSAKFGGSFLSPPG